MGPDMTNLFSGINARFKISGRSSLASPNSPHQPPDHSVSHPPSSGLIPAPSSSHAPRPLVPEGRNGHMQFPEEVLASYRLPSPRPSWLNANLAKHIVKGNFLTLSAKPKTVEMGEWMAHQVVDHWRMLMTFIKLVHDREDDGSSICNPRTCPKMTAGPNHTFTWLNSKMQPCEISAHEYFTLVQRYITGKIDDVKMFPTDPAGVSYANNPANCSPVLDPSDQDWIGERSGFPENFQATCQITFRQMFRVYSHLYWSHFDDVYTLNLEKSMNSCFSHFILTATTLNLIGVEDLAPMQSLMDLWAVLGTFPPGSKAHDMANRQVGQYLLQRSEHNAAAA